MSCKLFVGGLSWGTDDKSLFEHFARFGDVTGATVIKDRETGRSRGFGFVTFSSIKEADVATEKTNNTDFAGRTIKVDKAAERAR